MGRRTGFVLLTLLLGLVLAASPADAHGRKFPTQVSLNYDDTTFSGQVRSQEDACVSAREVTLFQRARGGNDAARGTVTTDTDGNYSFTLPGENGLFYVMVSAKTLPGSEYGHSHTCNGARSRTVKAGSGGVLGSALGQGGIGAGDSGLPFTGSQGVIALTALAAALIAAGVVLVRRNRSHGREPTITS